MTTQRGKLLILTMCFAGLVAGKAQAQLKAPVDRTIMAILDARTSAWGSNTRGSVVFYDPDVDMSRPLFASFTGFDQDPVLLDPNDPNSLQLAPGNFQDPVAIDGDLQRGDIITLATDSETQTLNADQRVSLYKNDFPRMYNHWLNNGGTESTSPSAAFKTYGTGKFEVTGDANNDHLNTTVLSGSVQLLSDELLVNQNDRDSFFPSFHDFWAISRIDDDNYLILDDFSGTLASGAGGTSDFAFRNLSRDPNGAWSSGILGYVNLDFSSRSEVSHMSSVVNKDGVLGVWVGEFDSQFTDPNDPNNNSPRNSDVAFFEITNLSADLATDPNTAGGAYRQLNIGDPNAFFDRFTLDENPTIANTNDGELAQIYTDVNGNLRILEKVFGDPSGGTAHDPNNGNPEPKVISIAVADYDDSGEITFGGSSLDFVDPNVGPDDDAFPTDDRWSGYDPVDNDYYLFENDGGSDLEFVRVDLDTGTTEVLTDPNGVGIDMAHLWLEPDGSFVFHFLRGDNNFDGIFDVNDIDLVRQARDAYAADPNNYDSLYDYDGDGDVDNDDIDIHIGTPSTFATSILGTASGDGNLDGAVDIGDFTLWGGGFGTPNPSFGDGDYNHDGSVDIGDFTKWGTDFGYDNGLPGPLPSPEPSSVLLLLVGGTLAFATRRFRVRK